MEKREGHIIASRAGGTASESAKTYKVSLPSVWLREMGLAGEDRRIELSFDGQRIILSPRRAAMEPVPGHRVVRLKYYDGQRLCSTIVADYTEQRVWAENFCADPVKTAFGRNAAPAWQDYEALAEAAASALLEQSNIETDTPFTFVRYRMERVNVHGRDRTGCSSEDFLRPGQSIVTLDHLLSRVLGKPLRDALARLPSDKQRLIFLAETTAEYTGLREFPQYLTLLFEVDGLFLNDDRHLNNIAVLEQEGRYSYCPIFDNGAGLLSNTQLSPIDIAPAALIKAVKARPFNTTFNRQVIAARNLYGPQLKMPKLTAGDIRSVIEPMLAYYPARDRGLISDRVTETILTRQRWTQQ